MKLLDTGADARSPARRPPRSQALRTCARRVPELAQRCRRAARSCAAGRAGLRDGARAAGLPAGSCSRDPASRALGAPDRRRAPPRCRPTRASGCISPRLAAVLADDYERAKARLGELLRTQPRDVLALQVAHAFDYVTGDVARLARSRGSVLPAWSPATARLPRRARHARVRARRERRLRARRAARAERRWR